MDDDLDALLDSALDTMTEQDITMEKEKQAHEAAAQQLLNEALHANSGAASSAAAGMSGMDAEMMKTLGGLMSILQKGPEAMENATDEEMSAITQHLQSTLDQLKKHPDLSSEDANQLGDMKKMMEQLNALDKGQAEGPNGEAALSEEEFNSRKEELTKMLEAMSASGGLMGGAGSGGPDLPSFPFAEMMKDPTVAAAAAAKAAGVPLPPLPEAQPSPAGNPAAAALTEEEACRQVFELTLGILQEKEIEQPFAKLKAAYGPWLEANASSLSAEDRSRYENQYRVASEMCDFFEKERVSEVLKEGGEASTAKRATVLERFGTLMAELHSFGEVPPTLFPEAPEEAEVT